MPLKWGEGVKMKRLFFGAVGVLLILAACSDMPTVVEPADNGIKMYQGGREVDSLLVGIMTIFMVTVPEGTNPVSYSWSFGDSVGVITNVPQAEHRYIATGNYLARVTLAYADGSSTTYSKAIRVYSQIIPPPPVDDILVLISSSQEASGKWTYRLGLSTQAYSNGPGGNPFITGEAGGIFITNPVNNTNYSWVQLVNNQQGGRLIVEVTCWDQSNVFINYGGNFIYGSPPTQWNWADITGSMYYVPNPPPQEGGDLHFALVGGQLLLPGGSGQLPGLLGDSSPATLRMTVLITDPVSIKLFFNLDRLENFQGGAWVEYLCSTNEISRQPLPLSPNFSGWGEVVLPLSALADDPIRVRYGHHNSDLADMSGSQYWIPTDGWLEFYLQPINGKGNQRGGWRMITVTTPYNL